MSVEKYIVKSKLLIKKFIKENNNINALNLIKSLAEIYYEYNQIYTDNELEEDLLLLKQRLLNLNRYTVNPNIVFFYDGFGLDFRGLAASYIKALTSLKYNVIYSCPSTSFGNIPNILSELDPESSKIIYIDICDNEINKIKVIDSIFNRYRPKISFFYTTPNDVAGYIAFANNPSSTRILVDLTDHAFWLGVNILDYIFESRNMGASIAVYQRGIESNKIIKIDCAPYLNHNISEKKLPFDIYKEKYIFTGGKLYKTLGDPEHLYYKTISYLLEKYKNIKFLYVGDGDKKEINKLISKYLNRVYIVSERADFFEIMKNCLIYINSYPMFGGLMMRYAALAGKVPITLKHENDSDGILINQDKLGIDFESYTLFIQEIELLLSDQTYRQKKEKLLRSSVYDDDLFRNELNKAIVNHKTSYIFENIQKFNTDKFRNEYKRRYSILMLYKSIAKKRNLDLIMFFPMAFVVTFFYKVKEKIRNGFF